MNCQRINRKYPVPKTAAYDHVHIKVFEKTNLQACVSAGQWFLEMGAGGEGGMQLRAPCGDGQVPQLLSASST